MLCTLTEYIEFVIELSKVYFSLPSSGSNQAYPLKLGSVTLPVYCHMTSLSACGDGGWTLVMKMNGSKVVLNKYLNEQTNKQTNK